MIFTHFSLLFALVASAKVTLYFGTRLEFSTLCAEEKSITDINLNHLKSIMQHRSLETVLIGPNHLAVCGKEDDTIRVEPTYDNNAHHPIICAGVLRVNRRNSGTGVHIRLLTDPKNLEIDGVLEFPRKYKKPVKLNAARSLLIRFPLPVAINDYNDLAQKLYSALDNAGTFHVKHFMIPIDLLLGQYTLPQKVSAQVLVFTVKRWIEANPHTSLRFITYALYSNVQEYKVLYTAVSEALSYHYNNVTMRKNDF